METIQLYTHIIQQELFACKEYFLNNLLTCITSLCVDVIEDCWEFYVQYALSGYGLTKNLIVVDSVLNLPIVKEYSDDAIIDAQGRIF